MMLVALAVFVWIAAWGLNSKLANGPSANTRAESSQPIETSHRTAFLPTQRGRRQKNTAQTERSRQRRISVEYF